MIVMKIFEKCRVDCSVHFKEVKVIAKSYRDKIFNIKPKEQRKRLSAVQFGADKIRQFVSAKKETLTQKISRPVDYICYLAFNEKSLEEMFIQVKPVYEHLHITPSSQDSNPENKGVIFWTRHDLFAKSGRSFVVLHSCCGNPRIFLLKTSSFSLGRNN